MSPVFTDLGVAVILAAIFGFLLRLFRQPTLVGYIVAGCVIGYIGSKTLGVTDSFKVFGELGITFLLFLIGLELNYSSLKTLGKNIILISLGQLVITIGGSFFLLLSLDYGTVPSLYLALAIGFSSTIIVVRLLSDKKDLASLHGKISVGILLVQDIVAIILLMLFSNYDSLHGSIMSGALSLIKGAGLALFAILISKKLAERIFKYAAKSEELLFITSLAWVFLIALIVGKLGFSLAIAGFLAGLSLSHTSEHYQIASKAKVLRDFFLILFFIGLGISVLKEGGVSEVGALAALNIRAVIGIVLLVLLLKPISILVSMGLLRYEKRVSFGVAITHSQISEFSLILLALGVQVGHLRSADLLLGTVAAIISIIISAYLIEFSNIWYFLLREPLKVFERVKKMRVRSIKAHHIKTVLLIGCHRLGQSIISHVPKENLLVVDFDPVIIEDFRKKGYDCLFGDMSNSDFLDNFDLKNLQLIISTSPDSTDTIHLLKKLKELKEQNKTSPRLKIIVRADHQADAEAFYNEGADYVVVPYLTSGQFLGKLVASDPSMRNLASVRAHDLNLLKKEAYHAQV